MDALTAVLAVAGLLAFGLLVAKAVKDTCALERRRLEKLDALWGEVAKRLDLRRTERFVLEGVFEGFRVRVEQLAGEDGLPGTQVCLSGERVARGVTLGREGAFAGLQKALSGEDVLVGDDGFDQAVRIAGPEDVVLAALPAGIRRPLMTWVGLGGTVRGGALTCRLPNDETSAERIPAALRELAGFAKVMAVGSVASALQANVEGDPVAAVRRRSLELLVRDYSGTKPLDAALCAALKDRDPGVVVYAAQNKPGAASREALVEMVADTAVAQEHRASAVEQLEREPWGAVKACVAKALYTKGAAVRHAAVRAAGRAKDASLLDDLVSMLPTEDEDLALALVGAFESVGGARAEKALVDLLTSTGSLPVKKAAAEALGRTGSVAVVEPLSALVDAGLVKDAARDAVRAIQARLGDAGAGRLSVVAPGAAGGALSLQAEAADRAKERG